MMSYEKNRAEKRKRLQFLALALLLFAGLSSLFAYFFLPPYQAEAFYMISLVLLAMAAVCCFGKPKNL